MKLADIKLYKYNLPLKKPLTLPNNVLTAREGLLIGAGDDEGHTGWGEIAPLPGFSSENLDSALKQCRKLIFSVKGGDVPDNLEELSGGFDNWLGRYHLFPSVRFGIESAVLNLLAESQNKGLAELTSEEINYNINLNAFLSGDRDDIPEKTRRTLDSGFTTFKIKVGRKSIEDDIELIKQVAETVGSDKKIRIDPNRSWNLDIAIQATKELSDINVEYYEEPLQNPDDLSSFHKQTGVKLALDESLADITPENFEVPQGVTALILKPTIVGGLEKSFRFIRRAHRLNLKCVISSTYESSLGLTNLLHLAAVLKDNETAHGLNTQKIFIEDITINTPKFDQPTVNINDGGNASPDLSSPHITEVTNE